jgi:hypothetical protein
MEIVIDNVASLFFESGREEVLIIWSIRIPSNGRLKLELKRIKYLNVVQVFTLPLALTHIANYMYHLLEHFPRRL